MTEENRNIGLGFSGGGIRSAALSSGVLRRLLHRCVKVDCISCVSGGNYTAAAYLDWKYRHGKQDDHKWHKEFFEHLRSRVGYFCNWERPLQGILDTVLLVLLLITVNLIIPCVSYSSGAFTAAFVIDYVFGSIMRKGFVCVDLYRGGANATERHCTLEISISDPRLRQPSLLFILLPVTFFVCLAIKLSAPLRLRSIARFLQIVTGVTFAFTFVPWLIQQFTDVLPSWLKASVVVLSIFFWLGFPPLRKKASLALVFYFYAFVIKWRVYQTSTSGIQYNPHLFYTLLLVSSFFIWMGPYLGMFSVTSIYTYYK